MICILYTVLHLCNLKTNWPQRIAKWLKMPMNSRYSSWSSQQRKLNQRRIKLVAVVDFNPYISSRNIILLKLNEVSITFIYYIKSYSILNMHRRKYSYLLLSIRFFLQFPLLFNCDYFTLILNYLFFYCYAFCEGLF